jgi:environmental stress-induced protein Ves
VRHTVAAHDVAPQRWKNGGGLTRELLAWPGPADWQLRISVADIEADGPFSAFPGVVRHFAVLEGDGVELRFADRACRVEPGDAMLRFDGASAPGCRLLGGPTRDLNVMHRAGLPVEVRPATGACPQGVWRGLFTSQPMSLTWTDDASDPCPAPTGSARAWWIVVCA